MKQLLESGGRGAHSRGAAVRVDPRGHISEHLCSETFVCISIYFFRENS